LNAGKGNSLIMGVDVRRQVGTTSPPGGRVTENFGVQESNLDAPIIKKSREPWDNAKTPLTGIPKLGERRQNAHRNGCSKKLNFPHEKRKKRIQKKKHQTFRPRTKFGKGTKPIKKYRCCSTAEKGEGNEGGLT